MIIIKLFIISAVVILPYSSATSWTFVITRNSTRKLTISLIDSIDKFNITKCSGSDDVCSKYGGQKLQDRCQCVCSHNKSTFGYYSGQWRCTENSIMQKNAACGYSFQRPGSKGENDPLFTLPVLGSHNDNNHVGTIPNKSCKVIAANATFLECNGTWGKLTESNVKRKLAYQDDRPGNVYIGPYQPSSAADPSLDGRVIKIPIYCEGLTWDPSQCVTFKLKGQLTCSTMAAPPSLVSLPHESTQTPPIPTTGKKITNCEGDDATPSAAMIAGSVVGAVFFILLIVVIITLMIYLRREKAQANERPGVGTEATERTADSGNRMNDSSREMWPDYQYPIVGMIPDQADIRMSETDGEAEPDYQYPRIGMAIHQADIRMSETDGEAKPDYQYPRIGMAIHQDPDYVNRSATNSDESPYEIMNSPYQNVGRNQIEHPYVNIC